jgi:transaldolase
MRPANLNTKIFLDSGDPSETKQVLDLLGFLDGQTTNPSLIAKNPETAKKIESGEKFSKEEIFNFYKGVVGDVSNLIPKGSVSIEVYADKNTSSEEMLEQGREFFTWVPNAHIKFPTTREGLKAANQAVKDGIRVNMTLVFSQEQAAAVYSATKVTSNPTLEGFKNVFISPFIGRLDDRGENGMDVIANIINMYQGGDGHVAVLTASVRSMDHFLYALKLGSDIITAPFKILKEWGEKGMPVVNDFIYAPTNFKAIPFKELDLEKHWEDFNISHDLTDTGIEKFSSDWNALLK